MSELLSEAQQFGLTISLTIYIISFKAVKMILTAAHRSLHNRMHNGGIFHDHSPMDGHDHPDHRGDVA